MFANPIWSVLILLFFVGLYFLVIRPRLRAPINVLYDGIEGWWPRIKIVVYKLRTFMVALAGGILIAAPDILVHIAPLDFSAFLPQPWAAYVGPFCMMAIALMKAFETTPADNPPPEG
jgi:hypothetical protein